MSVTLRGSVMAPAPQQQVWSHLIDWIGQERWIPSTTMRIVGDQSEGVGTRIRAFHGLQVGPLPLGLIDRFVVTGWEEPAEVEVTHLGPYFTGIGVFTLASRGEDKTWVNVVEVFDLPLAPVLETGARLLAPAFTFGLNRALRDFAEVTRTPRAGVSRS